jgi:hypothetical protein
MLKDVVFVEPKDDYRLRLRFEDGIEGIVDVTKLVSFKGIFSPLKDSSEFSRVRVNSELGTIEWECGADLDPDVLYAEITGIPIPHYDFVNAETR